MLDGLLVVLLIAGDIILSILITLFSRFAFGTVEKYRNQK